MLDYITIVPLTETSSPNLYLPLRHLQMQYKSMRDLHSGKTRQKCHKMQLLFSGSSAHHRENTAHLPKSSACPKKILAQALIISRALALMRVHCFRHLQVIQHHVLWIEIMSTSVSFLRLHFYSPQMKVVPSISSKSTSKFKSFIVLISAADKACRHKTSKFVPKLRQKHLIN